MNFFGLNITRQSKGATKSLDPDTAAWLRGQEPERGSPVLSNAYQQVVWVYRAINVLAEQIGNIPFLFSSGGRGRGHLINHGPPLGFFVRPHPTSHQVQNW